ncbi:16S rRNA (guanine(527)-N(7))-methyltransferase RsmG [Lachnospiraceae bacterium 50-23]|jgi:16S rRNA (guanine527-N7)-methyltransferase|nr:16S rRNA (guanine(527)-N(7))-methyltransferase RsmG [Dorea sp.]
MSHLLESKAKELSLTFSERQIKQFEDYYRILIEWNHVMNLTAITEYEEVVEKHFIDSLSIINAVDFSEIFNIIDIGTGAGFPGIPLKIAFPDINITLLDSLNKRVKFLNEVIEQLGLNNINAIHGRAEDYAKQKEYREQYDLCVSRAVANLSTLSEYCLPYVKINGLFIPYKSGDIDVELEKSEHAVSILGGVVSDVIRFQLPGTDIGRSFVKIKKIKSTGKKYPRKAGLPSKEPL